jgi:putative hydrolase of the HAD superfamily
MPIDLICLDADDTLWHNMRFFHATQEALVQMLEPFADAGIAASALEACEIRNLSLFGYGAKAFTLSMIETALELGGDEVPASVIRDILEAGKALHAHPVELFEGVEETVGALAERARLVLVTKGDLFHQEAKLAASGLGDLFTGIEIVSDKQPATFAGIFGRYDAAPDRALMAGDSMRSDILPALEAGAWAAYIPQPLGWSHEQRPAPADNPRFIELSSLAALVNWLDRAEAA